MSIQRLPLLAAMVLAICPLTLLEANAQSFLENVIGGAVDQAIKNSQRSQPPRDSGTQIRMAPSLPGESAKGNVRPEYQRGSVPWESGQINTPGFQSPPSGWRTPTQSPRQDTYYYPPQGRRVNQSTPRRTTSQSATTQPPTLPSDVANGQPISITFRKSQTGVCKFTIIDARGREYPRTLNPGQMQPLKGTSVWNIRYYGKTGDKLYRLRGGNEYVFQRDSERYLQLYRQPKEVIEEPPVLPQ